jgi:NAD(P)H-binding
MRVCIVGASRKLGRYMVQHCLDRNYEVVGVCRDQSVRKLDAFADRITIIPGRTNDRDVIKRAVSGCDGVLVVLAPWGVHAQYASGTAQAVLDCAPPGARLVFSCGWHIARDGSDKYSRRFRAKVKFFEWVMRLGRIGDLVDQVEATRRIFASDTRSTVVRGSDLEEGRAKGFRSGVATSVTRCCRATGLAGSTSLCSWSRPSPTIPLSMKRRRLSGGIQRRRSSTGEQSNARNRHSPAPYSIVTCAPAGPVGRSTTTVWTFTNSWMPWVANSRP